jgi:hypothetical protein
MPPHLCCTQLCLKHDNRLPKCNTRHLTTLTPPPHMLHKTPQDLFHVSQHPYSLIVKCFYCLLPHISSIRCAPSIPTLSRVTHFLNYVSTKSARKRIKSYCTNHIKNATYHEVCMNAPSHLHLLPSILSPQTFYPLIALCCSKPSNHLPP